MFISSSMAAAAWCTYVSLAVGSLFGFMFAAGPGLGKVLPAHPMFKEMVSGMAQLMGPFYGIKGDILRNCLGFPYIAAGLGMIVGLWCEFLGSIDGDLLVLAQALLICAPIGIITIQLGAGWFHIAVDGHPGPSVVLIPMMALLLYTRLQITPYEIFPSEKQIIIQVFIAVCGIGFIGAAISKVVNGEDTETLKDKAAEMKAAKEENKHLTSEEDEDEEEEEEDSEEAEE